LPKHTDSFEIVAVGGSPEVRLLVEGAGRTVSSAR
jgi:hypothetical protein